MKHVLGIFFLLFGYVIGAMSLSGDRLLQSWLGAWLLWPALPVGLGAGVGWARGMYELAMRRGEAEALLASKLAEQGLHPRAQGAAAFAVRRRFWERYQLVLERRVEEAAAEEAAAEESIPSALRFDFIHKLRVHMQSVEDDGSAFKDKSRMSSHDAFLKDKKRVDPVSSFVGGVMVFLFLCVFICNDMQSESPEMIPAILMCLSVLSTIYYGVVSEGVLRRRVVANEQSRELWMSPTRMAVSGEEMSGGLSVAESVDAGGGLEVVAAGEGELEVVDRGDGG